MVTLTRVASLPLTLIPVYPTPAPASEVVTTDGKKFIKIGISCPRFLGLISSLVRLENVTGDSFVTLTADTNTSSSTTLLPSKESVGCCWAIVASVSPNKDSAVKIKVFIRKKILRIKGAIILS